MKYFILCIVAACLSTISTAQSPAVSNDTLVQFNVAGACEMCKDRIETVAKIKGVRSAVWDVDSKKMTVTYNPNKTSLEKIQKRIVAAGHDIAGFVVNQKVYDALPDCCHYRDIESHHDDDHEADSTLQELAVKADAALLHSDSIHTRDQQYLKGLVLETDNKGKFKPLAGASVTWLLSGKGSMTNDAGVFSIPISEGEKQLIISYAGFRADTLEITNANELKIVLGANSALKEVIISSRQRSTFLASGSTVRTLVMTERELFKAACCNLSESFETNPSVDVSYNDAVTGSKQIQLLGLSGNYTQLTVENLPGPRGLATTLGLNSIAGPWIESIQLSKGTGSVANGYESIAGQINVELKKPGKSEQLYANAYINDFGKTDLNLNLSKQLSNKWSTALLLHDDFINNTTVDFNKDGFRDLPTGNQFSMINRWKFEDGKGIISHFGVKILTDKKTGGEVDFIEANDKYTSNNYGLGIATKRYEAFAKIGFVFPEKRYQSIGLQLSAIRHDQQSYFGFTKYNGLQQQFYSNLIYQSIINNTNHKFRTGLSLLHDRYDETFNSTQFSRKEIVPGAFFEYTYDYLKKISIVAGIRADQHNLFGWFITPRLNVKYEPIPGTVIHLSAGRGQRTANIFAENTSVLVSARQLDIVGGSSGKAYGLNPEIAWNKGISIDQQLTLFGRKAMVSVDFFRNDFTNQVITDLEDVRTVKFYNLTGRSYSNSLQAELSAEPFNKLDVRFAYRYFDVKATYGTQLLQRPFIASHRAFANIAYSFSGWKFDYTISFNGKKRIPGTVDNPLQYKRESYSPAYIIMGSQVSKTLNKKHGFDVYLGAENLANFFQRDVIIAADQPFSSYFDASMVWGPVSGRMFYAGFRYKIQ